ncbi:MAG TPA: hypothetical protein VFS62_02325, partial [Chloroflexota bacterium]|nr:hypothetical protein [Chloroflexota bacterium]
MKLLAALAATAIAVLASADVGLAQTPSADGSGLGTAFAVSPPRLEIAVSPGTSDVTAEISVTNLSPQREILTTTLNDMLVTKGGAYQAIAAATTSSAIARAGNLTPDKVELPPAGSPGATTQITLMVHWTDPDHALYGAIVVQPVVPNPPAPTGAGTVRVSTKIQPAVLIPLVLVPTQLDAATNELKPVARVDLEPASMVVDQPERAAGLDRLIPFTLPRVADHGPLQARVTVVNTGDALARATTHYQFTSVNMLAWLPQGWQKQLGVKDTLFLQVDSAPGPALPGNLAATAGGTEVNEPEHVFDTAPIAGLVRVTAETRMTLVDTTSRSVTQDGWIIVFPWKEAGSLLLVFGAILMVRRARRQRPRRPVGTMGPPPQLPVIREDVRGKPRLAPVGMSVLRVPANHARAARPRIKRRPVIRLLRRMAAGTGLTCMALGLVPVAVLAAPTATVTARATTTAAPVGTTIATATPVPTSTPVGTPA